MEAKGKGTVAIPGRLGVKVMHDVLYVLSLNRNLLSVGQLLEKGYKVSFEDRCCVIKGPLGEDPFKIKVVNKSFSLDMFVADQLRVRKVEADMIIKRG